MRLIGVIGRNGSGKDEVLAYLRGAYGIPYVATGDIVRALAAQAGEDATREALGALSERVFRELGPGCFALLAARSLAEDAWPVAGISGLRSLADVERLRAEYGDDLTLVHVSVRDPAVRFKRMVRRASARDPRDIGQFLAQEAAEERIFQLSEAIAEADVTIANDGTIEDLHRAIEEAIVRHELLEPAPARRKPARASARSQAIAERDAEADPE